MKNSLLFLSLVSIALTACTPKDVEVTDPNTRLKLQERKAGASGGSFKLGGASGALFILEKEIEAIELLKASQSPTFAAEHKLELTTTEAGTTLSTLVNASDWSSDLGKITSKQMKALNVETKLDGDNKVIQIKLTGKSLRSSVDVLAAKKSYLNLNEDAFQIKAVLENGQWKVNVFAKGSASANASGTKTAENFELGIDFVISQEDLTTAEIPVSGLNGNWLYVKAKGAPWIVSMEGKAHTVTSNAFCENVTGSFSGSSGKAKYGFDLNSDEWSISLFGKTKKASLNECSLRPVVDLSRLLISY